MRHQTSHSDFLQILSVLSVAQSTFVKPLEKLQDELNNEVTRAESNISHVKQLSEACEEVSASDSPSKITLKLPAIINTIRHIWLHSDYYNTVAAITKLYCFVGHQIIQWCRQKIDIGKILRGGVDRGKRLIESCIDCCVDYKSIYGKISTKDEESAVERQLDDTMIFNRIDTFIQRLYDCLEIRDDIAVFQDDDRSTEECLELKFGGDQTNDFDLVWFAIQTQFKEALQRVIDVADEILNVNNVKWLDEIMMYRTVTNCLDATAVNLMRNVLSHTNGMEEVIYALACLHRYAQRVILSGPYLHYVESVWKIFAGEIAAENQLLIDRFTSKATLELPKYAGRVIHLQSGRDRVMRMHSLLERATFLPQTKISEKILEDYAQFVGAANAIIQKQFDEWLQMIGIDAGDKLNRKLLLRSVTQPGVFECNIDLFVLDTFDEASTFKRLGFEFPLHVNQFFIKLTSTRTTFDSIVDMCVAYNQILKSFSDKERLLIRPLIQACDRIILPGVHKLTWASDGLDAYIGDCNRHIDDLKRFLTVYRNMNDRVVQSCIQICEVVVLHVTDHEPDTLVNIAQKLNSHCQQQIFSILAHHNDIVRNLFSVHDALVAYQEPVRSIATGVQVSPLTALTYLTHIACSRYQECGANTYCSSIV